ncbi:MFS transporter [Thermogemmatispora carboxidivorans]|uniref:MFS transporter n=1 Tax=Thermogemmatispora carboxidivorans TaxID=1382306 RepID=UPI00069C3C53|nr:MFS transporter [Thermogemmatispora carboxidivorans]
MKKLLEGLTVLRVLRHPALLRLWLAQVIYLSVQFTASYAMIVLITNETHSAVMVGLVIIALSLPLVLFGAPAGALVDRLDRRTVLWVSNVVRAFATLLFVLALLLSPHQYIFIYILAFFFSLVGLFFSPAEGAIIPSLVDEEELLPALSLYNLTLNASQAVGLLILGPLMLNLLPSLSFSLLGAKIDLMPVETLFLLISALYLLATILTATLPRQSHAGYQHREASLSSSPAAVARAGEENERSRPYEVLSEEAGTLLSGWQRLRQDLENGWRLVRNDGVLLDALFQSCFGGLVMLTIAELATTFVQRLLGLPASNTTVIFAPAGIGLVAGSLLVPAVVARLGSLRTMLVGMVGTGLGIALIPPLQWLARLLLAPHWATHPLFLLILAVLTAAVGFGLDLVVVPAQTLMQQRSPDEMRGRVLALFQVLFNGGAIPVMLFMGALTDWLGIVPVTYLLAGSCLLAALLTVGRALTRNDRDRFSGGPRQQPEAQERLPVP